MDFHVFQYEARVGERQLDVRRFVNYLRGGLGENGGGSRKRKQEEDEEQEIMTAKHTYDKKVLAGFFFGIEIEGCFQTQEIEEFTWFHPERDSSIRCASRTTPIEYISKKLSISDLTDATFRQEYYQILKENIGCAKNGKQSKYVTCGTHVHLSNQYITKETYPGFPAWFMYMWLQQGQRYFAEKYYRLQSRTTNLYSKTMTWEVFLNLNKYSMVNFRPSLNEEETAWHLEFRGLGELISTTRAFPRTLETPQSLRVFNRTKQLWKYMKDLTRFFLKVVERYNQLTSMERAQHIVKSMQREGEEKTELYTRISKSDMMQNQSHCIFLEFMTGPDARIFFPETEEKTKQMIYQFIESRHNDDRTYSHFFPALDYLEPIIASGIQSRTNERLKTEPFFILLPKKSFYGNELFLETHVPFTFMEDQEHFPGQTEGEEWLMVHASSPGSHAPIGIMFAPYVAQDATYQGSTNILPFFGLLEAPVLLKIQNYGDVSISGYQRAKLNS